MVYAVYRGYEVRKEGDLYIIRFMDKDIDFRSYSQVIVFIDDLYDWT